MVSMLKRGHIASCEEVHAQPKFWVLRGKQRNMCQKNLHKNLVFAPHIFPHTHTYFIDDTSTSCFWLLFVCVVVSVSSSNIAHKKQVVHRYTIKRLKFDVLASAHTKSVLYGINLWHTTFYNEL